MHETIADLKRYKVYDEGGERLGVLDDFIVDVDTWSIRYAVLRYEPAGEQSKLLGVTLDALALDSENEGLVVATEGSALRDARGIDKEAPPAEPEPVFRRRPAN